MAARYAFTMNPADANLYNIDGCLPVPSAPTTGNNTQVMTRFFFGCLRHGPLCRSKPNVCSSIR